MAAAAKKATATKVAAKKTTASKKKSLRGVPLTAKQKAKLPLSLQKAILKKRGL